MEKDEKTPARDASHGDAGGENKIVKTYADDMAKVIENDTGGLVKKIIHGEEEHEAEKRNLSPESKKNRLFMLFSLVLTILALATLSFFFFKKNINTVPIEKQFVPIIFNDQSAFLEVSSLNKDEISQTVLNQIDVAELKNGGVEGIYLTENKQIIGLRRFIVLMKSSFVPGDNTLFVNDNFSMGAVNNEADSNLPGNKDFFILLKVRSTADIFDSMRAWEKKMFADLHKFLRIDISSDTNYLLTKNFEDGIVENKNARMLYDKMGKLVVMYVFADDNSVVIAGTQNAAREIMLRLASGGKKQ
ncbi:MAG: hypothetical protein UU82_C0004G0004 [Candidatus Nomurabacteria bacterium GW2011_GWC2_41_8]|uniref:Uncharacterized protein n=2 Tax=Candidatus Nomuraibacteriota TaxID=1752729 RepID=A0A1F6YDN0_9BACT|nr:MAG: hypothetical protein UU82_C0004G0004 [Candidatus Nomurabacteria bacterium GW2011_GWC2_41_8]OGI67063.1 MAG: hypothetical protein A2823_00815 [Candidatus Nomurabacteria bacterium RIFCSPHIGHO2_01_FULL_41_91]OGI80106.1 MAG: hypothetical protein A3D43_01685 [Candidatus Nomurabacteria bacterium RIFCSPHIGHO2_02_FULL_41_52]OGI84465.1 MAG: hypothetical protein A3F49_03425 [Candidatus Nomurabacteria bacterium RIFCSPHIGHO2_12_FULL_42_19]OGI93690.1 MAG: hypothetical protein A3A07_02540 [Candidatus 